MRAAAPKPKHSSYLLRVEEEEEEEEREYLAFVADLRLARPFAC
jgi:hypothetical protein